jgi:hypothetical protein
MIKMYSFEENVMLLYCSNISGIPMRNHPMPSMASRVYYIKFFISTYECTFFSVLEWIIENTEIKTHTLFFAPSYFFLVP